MDSGHIKLTKEGHLCRHSGVAFINSVIWVSNSLHNPPLYLDSLRNTSAPQPPVDFLPSHFLSQNIREAACWSELAQAGVYPKHSSTLSLLECERVKDQNGCQHEFNLLVVKTKTKNTSDWAGEMVQRVRVLAALAEGPGSVYITWHMIIPNSRFRRSWHTCGINIYMQGKHT